MNKISETRYLVSALLLASIASISIFPQPLGQASVSEVPEVKEVPDEDLIFHKPIAAVFKEYIDHTIVGQTSFRSPRTPPNKKQVVVGRMWLFVTAYSSTVDQTDSSPFITASGTRVRDGIIAANFLPIGAKVRFPNIYGDKLFVVEDRMNSRYYYRADIWMPSRWEAKQFGLKNTLIEIIKEV